MNSSLFIWHSTFTEYFSWNNPPIYISLVTPLQCADLCILVAKVATNKPSMWSFEPGNFRLLTVFPSWFCFGHKRNQFINFVSTVKESEDKEVLSGKSGRQSPSFKLSFASSTKPSLSSPTTASLHTGSPGSGSRNSPPTAAVTTKVNYWMCWSLNSLVFFGPVIFYFNKKIIAFNQLISKDYIVLTIYLPWWTFLNKYFVLVCALGWVGGSGGLSRRRWRRRGRRRFRQ